MKPENWMKCDISPEDDPAYLWYLSKFDDKFAAHGFYNRLLALLYQSPDHWLTLDDIFVEGFAAKWGWQPDSVRQAVAYLIQARLLVAHRGSDDDPEELRFTSVHVLREVEARRRKSETNSQNGRKGGLKSGSSKRSLTDRPPPAERPPSVPQAEERRGEEIREDQKRVCGTPLTPRAGGTHTPPRDESLDPVERELESHFPQPDGQEWTRTNAFMNAGRRPLLKYPRIWLSRPELKHVLSTLRAKLPESHWREVFAKADMRLTTMEAEGKDASRATPALWLTGWALKEVLEEFNLEKRIARAQA